MVRPNEKGGAGYLGYEDKTFTIATSPDQWICTPLINPSPQPNPMNEPAQPAPVGRPIRYLSVCSGMEAASVAWHPLGWTPVGFSEIEPFPCAILKHRFPNTPNYGSLTEYQDWPLGPGSIDLLVGGTPCQSFSVAGLRKGLADPRGNLALTFLGLADKLKPKWIVWENVPGVLSSGGGRDFGSFLGALVELGYGFAYRVLDAQHFGVPQRRRRVFVVACLGDWRAAAEVLSLGEGLRGYLEAGNKKRKGAAADAGAGVEASGEGVAFRKSKRACSATDNETLVLADSSNTLNNFDLGDTRTTYAIVEPIPLDLRNAMRDADKKDETNRQGAGIGSPGDPSHTITSAFVNGVAHCSEVAPTVTSSGPPYSRTGNARVECDAVIVQASELRLAGKITEQSVCPTLKANAKSGDTEPLFVHPLNEAQGVDLYNQTLTGDLHVPLRTAGGHGAPAALAPVAFQPGNLVRKAGADPSTETFPTLTKDSGDQSPHVAVPPMAVRRLTPIECERLQGFPDNWSRISWKGKPEEDCPDGPRYKACGNSMAVPVMRWIGERIAAVDATLSR